MMLDLGLEAVVARIGRGVMVVAVMVILIVTLISSSAFAVSCDLETPQKVSLVTSKPKNLNLKPQTS